VRSEVWLASTVAFVASFCTLVIELVAGRIMAPYVGVSLYTWTSIIGVVLAGISLGAYLGGMLADRYPRHATLRWLLLCAGLAALAIAPLADIVGAAGFLAYRISLMTRILLITLKLDHLIHSYTHMGEPLYLAYDYLRIYEELVAWRKSRQSGTDRRNEFLFVGGGGHTLPRYLDARYPDMTVDVVEIDPWVTRVAREQLGIDRTRVHSFNADGRWYVMHCTKKYDFIVGDAFNDLSIPYHLTTREFDRHLKNVLNEDGLLMALVIDNVRAGRFLPTYIRTLQDVFGEDHVHLITLDTRDVTEIGTETAIVLASSRPLDMEDFRRFLDERSRREQAAEDGTAHQEQRERVPQSSVSSVVPSERLQAYMRTRARPPFVLRDDYVPADNLVAPMFEERYGFKKKGD
jgi:spermidine synthase